MPAAVRNLSLGDAGTDHLTITWSPAPGDVDHYEVQTPALLKERGSDGVLMGFLFDHQVTLLFNDTRVFPPVALASDARQHRLTALTPGRHYKIVVSTFSGPYERAQFIGGQTGESTSTVPSFRTWI